jgi:hypothetical protein
MSKLTYFLIFNVAVYLLYAIIDKLFTALGLYSSPDLGKDLFVMPTTGDTVLISINILVSSVGAWYLIRKIKEGMDT